MRPAVPAIVAVMLAALAATACSPSDEPAAQTTTANPPAAAPPTTTAAAGTTTTAATSGATGQAISVTVSGGKVNPAPGPVEVKLGSTVVIEVTADVADEIHVHGYDLTQAVQPNQPGRVEVPATIPGQFEVELENARLLLLTLRVS